MSDKVDDSSLYRSHHSSCSNSIFRMDYVLSSFSNLQTSSLNLLHYWTVVERLSVASESQTVSSIMNFCWILKCFGAVNALIGNAVIVLRSKFDCLISKGLITFLSRTLTHTHEYIARMFEHGQWSSSNW